MSERNADRQTNAAAALAEPGPKRVADRSARAPGRSAAWAILVLTLGGAVGACGAQPQASAAAAPTPPPAEVSALTILFVPSAGDETTQAANTAVQNALVKAGYKLVLDKRAKHDIAVSPTMTATQEQSFMQVTVNGEEQVKLRVHLTLEVASRGQTVDQLSTEFVTPAGKVAEGDVLKLVSGFGASPRVAQFARDRKRDDANKESAHAAPAAPVEVPKKLANEKGARPDSEWDAIVGGCRQPTALASCDSLKKWYASTAPRRREGIDSTRSYQDVQQEKKREEARQILEAAAPAMNEFAEADLWSRVDLPRCSAATVASDCSSLTEYFRRFPIGKHIEEVKKSLDEGNKRIAAKEEQERRRAEAEQRAAAARASSARSAAASDRGSASSGDDPVRKAIANQDRCRTRRGAIVSLCKVACRERFSTFDPGPKRDQLIEKCEGECYGDPSLPKCD